MKLGFEDYPFNKFSKIGPKVFINRLIQSIKKNNLCKISANYLPFYDIAVLTVLAKNYFNKPYLVRFDGLYNDKNNTIGDTRKLNSILQKKTENASGIIFQSEFTKKFYEAFFGKTEKKSEIIYNRIDTSRFVKDKKNFRDQISKNQKEKIIVVSASWRRHKRLEESIELIKLINKDDKYKFKLLVLGETNLQKIKDEEIFFAGHVNPENLYKWYQSADLYLHPAWIDSAPNTIMEAIACKIPCIGLNNGGVSEMISLCDAGITCDADKKYNFDYVDLYNPPKPDFKVIKNAIFEIMDNYNYFKERININNAEISITAKEYVKFANKVYNSS